MDFAQRVTRAFLLVIIVLLATACSDSKPAASSASSSGGGDLTAYCTELKFANQLPRTAASADVIKAFDRMVATAPDDIKADVVKFADAVKTVADLHDQLSSSPERQSELEQSQSSLAASVKQAGVTLTAYAKAHCGIDISGSSPPPSS